jgi:hypothetical protein
MGERAFRASLTSEKNDEIQVSVGLLVRMAAERPVILVMEPTGTYGPKFCDGRTKVHDIRRFILSCVMSHGK